MRISFGHEYDKERLECDKTGANDANIDLDY